jgi:hypothetical protein
LTLWLSVPSDIRDLSSQFIIETYNPCALPIADARPRMTYI